MSALEYLKEYCTKMIDVIENERHELSDNPIIYAEDTGSIQAYRDILEHLKEIN